MDNKYPVEWTRRSLQNALAIKHYLTVKFTNKEVDRFERLLKKFEKTVSNFPSLYPESEHQKFLRRAVIHKNTTVFYIFKNDHVIIIAMKDNRQQRASS